MILSVLRKWTILNGAYTLFCMRVCEACMYVRFVLYVRLVLYVRVICLRFFLELYKLTKPINAADLT